MYGIYFGDSRFKDHIIQVWLVLAPQEKYMNSKNENQASFFYTYTYVVYIQRWPQLNCILLSAPNQRERW